MAKRTAAALIIAANAGNVFDESAFQQEMQRGLAHMEKTFQAFKKVARKLHAEEALNRRLQDAATSYCKWNGTSCGGDAAWAQSELAKVGDAKTKALGQRQIGCMAHKSAAACGAGCEWAGGACSAKMTKTEESALRGNLPTAGCGLMGKIVEAENKCGALAATEAACGADKDCKVDEEDGQVEMVTSRRLHNHSSSGGNATSGGTSGAASGGSTATTSSTGTATAGSTTATSGTTASGSTTSGGNTTSGGSTTSGTGSAGNGTATSGAMTTGGGSGGAWKCSKKQVCEVKETLFNSHVCEGKANAFNTSKVCEADMKNLQCMKDIEAAAKAGTAPDATKMEECMSSMMPAMYDCMLRECPGTKPYIDIVKPCAGKKKDTCPTAGCKWVTKQEDGKEKGECEPSIKASEIVPDACAWKSIIVADELCTSEEAQKDNNANCAAGARKDKCTVVTTLKCDKDTSKWEHKSCEPSSVSYMNDLGSASSNADMKIFAQVGMQEEKCGKATDKAACESEAAPTIATSAAAAAAEGKGTASGAYEKTAGGVFFMMLSMLWK